MVDGHETVTRDEFDALLVALWRIRMEAERATIDEPPWVLPSRIIHLALGALGGNKARAQELAGRLARQ